MSGTTKGSWFRRIGLAAVAALTLGAVTLPSTPADARVFVGFGVPGWGYTPAYYGYPYGYGYPAYGYGYGYGYPGVYFGFGGGWHHHRHW